jgi:hypothetical protein
MAKYRLKNLSFDEAKHIHSLIDLDEPESRIVAANELFKIQAGKLQCKNVDTATSVLRAAHHFELDSDNYLIGATLCWGTYLFDHRPKSVQLTWAGMQTHPQLLIFGSGSQGKSYTAIAFALQDWERDPEGTTTKLVSTTAGHERAQSFSNLVRLHRFSAIPLSGEIKEGFIGLDKHDKRSSISEVSIDKGDENKSAKLQGFHPLPRLRPHWKFGMLTRVRGVFDEAEDIPLGLWKGEANMMLNLDDEMHVAIVAMWNPKNRASMAAQKAEPIGGWSNLDESLDEYVSKDGYHCIRLDARRSENVIQQKTIYIGHQTYEGYKMLEERGGPEFETFGKGIYPLEIAAFGIIDPLLLERQRGVYIWSRTPTPIATLDMAEEGLDEAFFTAFKYGKALGFQPEGRDRIIFTEPRWCIQVEQQFPLRKQNTILMGKNAIEMCHLLNVSAEWFGLDCSNTTTLRDWLLLKWGQILGFKWGAAATELPILHEDKEKCVDLFDNLKTEMWFSTKVWIEFGYLAFSPALDTAELFNELSGMRYKPTSKVKKRCEDTREFKKRFGGKSPDRASSVIMGPQLVRQRSPQFQRPAMEPTMRREVTSENYEDAGADIVFEETAEVTDDIEWVR